MATFQYIVRVEDTLQHLHFELAFKKPLCDQDISVSTVNFSSLVLCI